MTFLEFLDKQLARINGQAVAGAGIFILTAVVLWLAATNPGLRKDELFRVLAQAIVVQGLVGLAMASWFTVKQENGPTETKIVNEPSERVPVEED